MCPNGNAELTRKVILNSAIEIVSKEGLETLTAGRLIEQAGISKGGLYHHFRTMDQVKLEVLELLSSSILFRINSYPVPSSQDEFLDLLEQELFDCFVTSNADAKALFSFISSAAHEKKIQICLRQFNDSVNLLRLKRLQAVLPTAPHVQLNNILQVVSTIQLGLMTRYFIADDLTSLKNYWRGCRSMVDQFLTGAQSPITEERTTADIAAFNSDVRERVGI